VLTRSTTAKHMNAIGVLDIGTSKTACIIVSAPDPKSGRRRREGMRILGYGCKPSRGLKAGVVIDHDGAEQATRATIMQAEQMAGVTIDEVFLAVTCGRLMSRTFAADTRIESKTIGSSHVERLMAAGRKYAERDGGTLLHINHVGYRVDGAATIANPLGMTGTTLAADLHAITVDDTPLRSLLNVIERAGFLPTGVGPAPYGGRSHHAVGVCGRQAAPGRYRGCGRPARHLRHCPRVVDTVRPGRANQNALWHT
jgi:cell division protein FtsA